MIYNDHYDNIKQDVIYETIPPLSVLPNATNNIMLIQEQSDTDSNIKLTEIGMINDTSARYTSDPANLSNY